MKQKTWYFLALLLPLIFPIVLLAFGFLFMKAIGYKGLGYNDPIYGIGFLLMLQLFFGGIQYLIFIIPVAWWGFKKPVAHIQKYSWILPILFVPVCALGYLLIFQNARHLPYICGMALAFGYFYVFLAHSLIWLLQKSSFARE